MEGCGCKGDCVEVNGEGGGEGLMGEGEGRRRPGVVEVVEERLRRWEAGDADEERRVSLALTDLRMLLNAND